MNHSDSLLVSSGFSWRGGKQLGNNHDALFQTSGPAATAAVITATTAATAPLGQCSRVNKNKLIINFSNKSSFLTMHSKLIFELILLPISQLFHQSILQLILHPISQLFHQSILILQVILHSISQLFHQTIIHLFPQLISQLFASADQWSDHSEDYSADPQQISQMILQPISQRFHHSISQKPISQLILQPISHQPMNHLCLPLISYSGPSAAKI